MGVIKKNDPKLGICTSTSEESLHIPGSDDEVSIASSFGDAANVHPPPPSPCRNIPVPISFINRRRLGRRQLKRQENVLQLETLVEEADQEEISITDFMQNTTTGFTKLYDGDNMEKWYTFIESSDDTQNFFLEHTMKQKVFKVPPCTGVLHPGEKEFRRIKSGMRNRLKHTRIPMGMLSYLESEITAFFTTSPHCVYSSNAYSSFERLLLHAISQYHLLLSYSVTDKESDCRLVRIRSENGVYVAPEIFLHQYLETRKHEPDCH